MKPPRILIADDHELMLDGLRTLLAQKFDLVATVTDGRSAVAAYEKYRPDLLMLDISLPLLNGIEAARKVMSTFADARILFVTMQTDRNYVEQAFRAGAFGYLLKQAAAAELIHAINTVLAGRYYVSPHIAQNAGNAPFDERRNPAALFSVDLTPRQREVLQLIAEGKAMKEIAEILSVSVRTVEYHKNCISEELGIRTTAELTRYALEHGFAGV